jgi:Uma2 family endonuclease
MGRAVCYHARVPTARQLHYTYAEYLAALEMSQVRLEYSAGEIYAMAGGTPEHAALAAACVARLRALLPATCQVFSSDLKVRIDELDLATFSDASVVCGPWQRSPVDNNAIINPTLLVEVTSPSTRDYDRGEKLRSYQKIASLGAVIFVAHDQARITLVERSGEGWTTRDWGSGQDVAVTSPAVSFNVDDVYRGIVL